MQHLLTAVVLVLMLSVDASAQFADSDRARVDEHAPWGHPDGSPWERPLSYRARNGYIMAYDDTPDGGRVPNWVAYKVNRDFLRKDVSREREFAKFRKDESLTTSPVTDDYKGFFRARGFARGHLAPWAVMGGDRDGDGKLAKDDPEEAKTFFEANHMTNIAPQHHNAFNGSGGMWFQCERLVQNTLVGEKGLEVFVTAGCIFGPGEHEAIGPDGDIWVPAMFYKIIAWKDPDGGNTPKVLAFLFPHHRAKHGKVEHFLVTVDVIEAMTGLDFFWKLTEEAEETLEDTSTWLTWQEMHRQRRRPAGGQRGAG